MQLELSCCGHAWPLGLPPARQRPDRQLAHRWTRPHTCRHPVQVRLWTVVGMPRCCKRKDRWSTYNVLSTSKHTACNHRTNFDARKSTVTDGILFYLTRYRCTAPHLGRSPGVEYALGCWL